MPITRLDVLVGRNLLIYFDALLQRRLLALFHYSLRSGGILLLGSSETVGSYNQMFSTLQSKLRLYLRQDNLHQDNEAVQVHGLREELQASNEELQSTNEELQTINNELQTKLDALALAQSDLQNTLNSIEIAILFLDQNMHVRRYTDRAAAIINLRESDIGRPLSDLTTSLQYPTLHADAQETLRTLVFSEKQAPTADGRWFSVRIMPYRRLDNMIDGVVITLVDITKTKALESSLRLHTDGA